MGSRGGWLLVLPRAGGRVPLPAGSLGWEPAFPAGEAPQRSDKGMGVRVPPFVLGSWCTRLRRQKPLDARLAGGWSGINAPRGLHPRRGPFFGGGQSDKVPPPFPAFPWGRGRSLLVRGVAGSGREFPQLPCAVWLGVSEPCLCRSWVCWRVVGQVLPQQGNRGAFWGYLWGSLRGRGLEMMVCVCPAQTAPLQTHHPPRM